MKFKFGDVVINKHAGECNPHRIGTFVELIKRRGRINSGDYFKFTNGKGDFWEIASGDESDFELLYNV